MGKAGSWGAGVPACSIGQPGWPRPACQGVGKGALGRVLAKPGASLGVGTGLGGRSEPGWLRPAWLVRKPERELWRESQRNPGPALGSARDSAAGRQNPGAILRKKQRTAPTEKQVSKQAIGEA